MNKVIVITGASSGFGALTARALARGGDTVYATMRGTTGRNAPQVAQVARYAWEHGVDLRTVELDVASMESVEHGTGRNMDTHFGQPPKLLLTTEPTADSFLLLSCRQGHTVCRLRDDRRDRLRLRHVDGMTPLDLGNR